MISARPCSPAPDGDSAPDADAGMLRISRRAGERIMLGDNTIIEVLEVRGQTVRIGIDAPRAIPVYREEIWLEVKRRIRPPPRRRQAPSYPT